MKPIEFKEQTKVLRKPQNMTDAECGSLPVFNDSKQSISCWRANIIERVKFIFSGRVWLGVYSGQTQPPVWLGVKYPFKKAIE